MDRPTSVVLIALYCFLFGLAFMFIAMAGIIHINFVFSVSDFKFWLMVVFPLVLMVFPICLGVGILRFSNKCWKALFFLLLFFIASISSLLMTAIILLLLSLTLSYSFIEILHIHSIYWIPFLFCFLSQIIIFYYLTREEVRSFFGE